MGLLINRLSHQMKDPFTAEDRTLIEKKIDQGFFSLARTYGPFVIALVLAYFYTKPKGIDHKMSASQYDSIYLIVFGFFLAVFCLFAVKDYKKKILPLKKELASGARQVIHFNARKYFDPIYKKHCFTIP
jgi:hypothetical protein